MHAAQLASLPGSLHWPLEQVPAGFALWAALSVNLMWFVEVYRCERVAACSNLQQAVLQQSTGRPASM